MRSLFLSLPLAVLVVVVSPFEGPAQSAASASSAAPADKYAGESFVIERADSVYSMNADGTGYKQRTVAVKIQSEAALQQFGVIAVPFAGATEHVEFHYARVREPDGTVTETPVAGVIEQPEEVTRAAPFYSDLKEEQLPIKNLRVGDTLEWEARVVRTQPEAPNEFWGSENFVTEGAVALEQSVELRVPATKMVTVWTDPALGLQDKATTEGGERVYRWEYAALKPTVGAEAEAEKAAKKTRLLTAAEELDAEQGKLPSVAWTTFPSWAAVGAWYRGLESDRAVPDAEIKAKVAELTAGKTSEEDKVRAVYAYVSTQIRYIGVAFGVGRYQPHQAVDVLHNQYGDCKDKATLLTAMLAAAGVPSDAALIGADVRFNEAVPSPGSFNHLITHLKLDGQDVWLDSTEEVAPYRMMYAALRDREALVVPPTGDATLERTPANAPFAAFQTWTAKGTLDANGISDSHITLALRGDDALMLRAAMRQVGPAQYDEIAQRMLNALGYAGTSSHAEFSRPEDTDAPFTIDLDYHREKAGDWDNLRIIPQLAPVPLPFVDEKQPPVATINLGEPRTETSTAEMKLPAGWTVELPEAVHEKAAFATYDLSYRFDKGTLYSERRVVVLEQKIPAKDWKTYKKFADAVGVGNETYVQLRRENDAKFPGASKVSAPVVSQPKFDPAAESLIEKAMTALRAKDTTTADSLLKQAQALNPQQTGLWSGFGYVALQQDNKQEALQDMMLEIQNHPDSDDGYRIAAQLLQASGDLRGAAKMLRKWSDQRPTNPLPLIPLAEVLLSNRQPAEAAEAANKAWDMLTEDGRKLHPELKLTMGLAEMRSGMQEKGVPILTEFLKTSSDPMTINNVAYELASANKELPLDEEKQRLAVETLTKWTEGWTLSEPKEKTRAVTNSLVAAWDTMGWILFREGKVREAKPFIEAAWRNRPDEDVKEHVEQVNAKLGLKSASTNPADALATRTYRLGPPEGRRGIAEYRLLIVRGQVEQAQPAGEKTVSGAEQVIKRARMGMLFPMSSNAKLVHNAMLNCYQVECELVLLP